MAGETVVNIVSEVDTEVSERLKEYRGDLSEDAACGSGARRQAKPHIHDALPLKPVKRGELRYEDGVVANLDVRGGGKAACRSVVHDVAERIVVEALVTVPQVGVPSIKYNATFLGLSLIHI